MAKAQSAEVRISNFKLVLTEEDRAFILKKMEEVLRSHRWTVGPFGKAFEEEFRKFSGAKEAIAVVNGGAALVALLQALKIAQGSIVICPTLTAPPTPHAILNAGMKVVFTDSDPQDLGLDPEDVKRKLRQYKGKVSAVIAVHVAGWISPKITDVYSICREYGIPLIEDCAHAHGSSLRGRLAGSISKLAAYSFFMTKPLTCGEGGIVTTEDEALANRIRLIRNYGKDEGGKHVMNGFNYKLSEFNAVVALWATIRAPQLIEERRKIAANYDQLLESVDGIRIVKVPGCESSYYKYVVAVEAEIGRDAVRENLLTEYGIEVSGGVYDTLCHEEPYFRSISDQALNSFESFPQAERFARQQLCLPLYPGLTKDEQGQVIDGLKQVLEGSRKAKL